MTEETSVVEHQAESGEVLDADEAVALRRLWDTPGTPWQHIEQHVNSLLTARLAKAWDQGASANAENFARKMYDDGDPITNPFNANSTRPVSTPEEGGAAGSSLDGVHLGRRSDYLMNGSPEDVVAVRQARGLLPGEPVHACSKAEGAL